MPHKCPICEGKGKLKGFYPDAPTDQWVDCRACLGKGVINEFRIAPTYPVPYPYPQPYPVPSPIPQPWRPLIYWSTEPITTVKPDFPGGWQITSVGSETSFSPSDTHVKAGLA